MKHIPIYQVMIVRDGTQKADNKKINSPAAASEILSSYLQGADREHFVVLLLNTQNNVIGINTVSIGTLNASVIHPREVFKPAILANSSSIIIAHNHPSGNPTPSEEDLNITRKLNSAGDILGIPIRDHIIIGDDCYFSFKEKGLIQ